MPWPPAGEGMARSGGVLAHGGVGSWGRRPTVEETSADPPKEAGATEPAHQRRIPPGKGVRCICILCI